MKNQFIVQAEPHLFLASLKDPKKLVLTPFMSCAVDMSYSLADQICRKLRDMGHSHAVVCDVTGSPITRRLLYTMMQQTQETAAEVAAY